MPSLQTSIIYVSIVLCCGDILRIVAAPHHHDHKEVRMDTCYDERKGLFPCSSTITGNFILMLFYGAVLGVAAKFISDGAEMLLDFGLPPSIIGGVVLPIMGAVPDSAIIVASGMGKDAQEKLSVGMGTLAGSTTMLLTIAWSASLTVGKCDLDKNGDSIDQSDKAPLSLKNKGATILPEIKPGIYIMLATSLLYLVVQSSDWYWGATLTGTQPLYVKRAALSTMILCMMGFFGYILYSILDTKRTERIQRLHKEELMKRKVLLTMLTLQNSNVFKTPMSPSKQAATIRNDDGIDEVRETALSRKYFKAWRIKTGIRDIKERQGAASDSEDERQALLEDKKEKPVSIDVSEQPAEAEDSTAKKIVKCVSFLVGGVLMVTIFSDPMCDVLTAMTDVRNKSYIPIPSFYVSFIVTPFCSNASELVSSLIFASKKTKENATMTYSQLFGAATMNNTLCLAIFMGLVYFKDLEWIYGAEIICIILVQWVVGIISFTKTYKLWMAIPVGLTYVLCIGVVWVLEYKLGWH